MAQTTEVQSSGEISETGSIELGLNDLSNAVAVIMGMRHKIATNKTASTAMRNKLMDIINLSHQLRKDVLAQRKTIPVKPRAKKEQKEEEPMPTLPPLLERQPALEPVSKFDLRPTTGAVPKAKKNRKADLMDMSKGV
jgi:hypothetical protein